MSIVKFSQQDDKINVVKMPEPTELQWLGSVTKLCERVFTEFAVASDKEGRYYLPIIKTEVDEIKYELVPQNTDNVVSTDNVKVVALPGNAEGIEQFFRVRKGDKFYVKTVVTVEGCIYEEVELHVVVKFDNDIVLTKIISRDMKY